MGIAVLSTGCLLVVLVQTAQGQGGHVANYACEKKDDRFTNQTLQDLTKALCHQTLDITFILDISGSIHDDDFAMIRLFVLELFNYASSVCNMYIHPDYTRTEIILFDHLAALHVANYSRHIHGCEFLDILENLERPARRGGTLIWQAMQEALRLFQQNSGDRPVESQVLFILTDGGFQDEPFKIELMSTRLGPTGQGVQVYTVGVGRWLITEQAEQNIEALATNKYNYACIEDWLLLLNPGKAEYNTRAPIWAEGTLDQQEECVYPACTGHARCACDVTRAAKGYQCACAPGYYLEDTNCIECPKYTCKEVLGNEQDLCVPCGSPTNAGLVAGLVVAFLILALLVALWVILWWLSRKGVIMWLPDWCFCVCCKCCFCCYCCKEKTKPVSGVSSGLSHHRPPPPVPVEATMTPSPGYSNPNYTSAHGYEKPGQASRESSLYENLQHVRTNGKTDELKGMEKYMELACSSGTFKYLAIYIIQSGALACSPGLILDVGQVNDVIMIMKSGKKGAEVTLMQKTFRVDRAQKNAYVHAMEVSVKRGGRLDTNGPSALWVVSMGDYVVLGIGPASEDSNMQNEVFNLRSNMA